MDGCGCERLVDAAVEEGEDVKLARGAGGRRRVRRRAAQGLRRAYGACRARGGAASCVCGRPACAGEAERAGGRGVGDRDFLARSHRHSAQECQVFAF